MWLEFLTNVLRAGFLFLIILAGNQGAHVAKLLKAPGWNTPVSQKWLGANKTLAPYYVAPFLSAVVFEAFSGQLEYFYQGALLGLGAVLGDHLKSFFKRRLGRSPGSPWFFDRIDFAIGGALMAKLIFDDVTWLEVVLIILIAWPVHYFGNRMSHRRGWRDTPD